EDGGRAVRHARYTRHVRRGGCDEGLTDVDRAGCVVVDQGPDEIVVSGSGADETERRSRRAARLLNPDVEADKAGGRAARPGELAFVAQKLQDAGAVGEGETVGG